MICRITSNLRRKIVTFFPRWKNVVRLKFEEHIRSESLSHIMRLTPLFWSISKIYKNTDLVIIPSGMTMDDSEQSGEGSSSSENESATQGSLDDLSD
jgi:hypothetical protein